VDDDSVRIDITAIIHSFTSGAKPNYGIIIKSLQEMTNFGSLEFWDFDTAPAGKKPYVRVIYTPPYLKAK
jgi:hypothetical protein